MNFIAIPSSHVVQLSFLSIDSSTVLTDIYSVFKQDSESGVVCIRVKAAKFATFDLLFKK